MARRWRKRKTGPGIESDEAKAERLMQLTLTYLSARGWLGSICERRPYGKAYKTDFLGFADIVAVRQSKEGKRTVSQSLPHLSPVAAIQVTTLTGVIERLQKIDQHLNSPVWDSPPHRIILVVGWHTEYTLSRRWDFQPAYSLSSSTCRRISSASLNSKLPGAKPLIYQQRME